MDNQAAHHLDASDVEQRVRVLGGKEVLFDKEGFLWHPEDWTEEVAAALARESGIEHLSDAQWRVIRFLQGIFFLPRAGAPQPGPEGGTEHELMELECCLSRRDPSRGAPRGRAAEPKDVLRVGGLSDKMIYLDNAATTFPKPASVLHRMVETYLRMGVSPGRGSYDLATEAEEYVADTRAKAAKFFGGSRP